MIHKRAFMKKMFIAACLFFSNFSDAQNVGIGTNNPVNGRLVVAGPVTVSQAIFGDGFQGVSIESNPSLIGFNNYYNESRKYISNGHASSLFMDVFSGTMSLVNYGTGLKDQNVGATNSIMTILANGHIGIGNSNPALAGLTVDRKAGAANAIFGSNTTGVSIESSFPGVGFNTYFSAGRRVINTGFGALANLDPGTGRFAISTSSASVSGQTSPITLTERLSILPNGFIGIEGNTAPTTALSFGSVLGKKVSLYHGASGDAGFGVFGNELRIHSDYNNADITFGYDNYNNGFTENLRLKANGNVGIGTPSPSSKLDVNGSFRSTGKAVFDNVIQIKGGSPASGDVLKAMDANGNAAWESSNQNTGFLAAINTNQSVINGNTALLPFRTNIMANDYFGDGNHFNNSNGTYTVPASGVYLFRLTAEIDPATPVANSTMVYLNIRKNGGSINLAAADVKTSAGVPMPTFFSMEGIILKLIAGDVISAVFGNFSSVNIVVKNGNGTQFSGVRIY